MQCGKQQLKYVYFFYPKINFFFFILIISIKMNALKTCHQENWIGGWGAYDKQIKNQIRFSEELIGSNEANDDVITNQMCQQETNAPAEIHILRTESQGCENNTRCK